MKIFRKLSVILIVAAFIISPTKADALVPPLLPFGGWPVLPPIPCTCSLTLWSFMAPLYLVGSVPLAGPLVYVPYATIPLANFLPTIPLTPQMGAYIPVFQACWVGFPPFCVPLPSIGFEVFVGTGLPGGI